MHRRARILFAVSEWRTFLTHRAPLAYGARDAGFEVHVAVPPDADRGLLEREGLRVHTVPYSRGVGSPAAEVRSAAGLLRAYRRARPDLVHLFTPKVNVVGGPGARLLRVPALVCSVTGLGYAFAAPGMGGRALRVVLLSGLRTAFRHPRCAVIFHNADDRNELARLGVQIPENSVILHGSGVDLDQFSPQPEPRGVPVVAFVGRLLWDKGPAEFIEAARRLRARGVVARFVLVGDTDAANPAGVPRGTVQRWADERVVEWWGYRADMPEVMAGTHVIALPVRQREGAPKALLEAAAAGRPVVTTDVPGCRDVVLTEQTGIVLPPRDPARLADALARLVADSGLRARMGAAGRTLAEQRFSVKEVVRRTLAVYAAALQGPEVEGVDIRWHIRKFR
jgi:glycosyltransferase involved in cell wall biosynthesis